MKKSNKNKFRDWHSVNAHFRNSAGSMGDKAKEEDKYRCRNFSQRDYLRNHPPVWEEFPGAVLTQSFPACIEDKQEVKKIIEMEQEMWEYYKIMRPDEDNEGDE